VTVRTALAAGTGIRRTAWLVECGERDRGGRWPGGGLGQQHEVGCAEPAGKRREVPMMLADRFAGKVAVVTGAAQGIGTGCRLP